MQLAFSSNTNYFPYLDKGDFSKCTQLMADYQEILYDKEAWLGPIRKSELLLYTTLVHIGNQEYKTAKKYISNAIIDHNIKYLPLMRTIRLVRLIVFYEVQEHELIQYESRSITRSLSSPKEQTFKTERIILWFLNKKKYSHPEKKTEKHFGKSCLLRFMNYIIINMKVILRLFDFTAWMESKNSERKTV